MESLNLAFAVVVGLTLVLGLFAGVLQSRAYVLSDPMIATGAARTRSTTGSPTTSGTPGDALAGVDP